MSDSTITCPQCGNSMPAGGRFCINCGHIIESPVEQPAAEAVPTMQEATEPGMPGESMRMSDATPAQDEGAAVVSGSIGSSQGEDITEGSPVTLDDLPEQSDSMMQSETTSPAPQSWYESLAASPGDDAPTPLDSNLAADSTPEGPFRSEPEEQSTLETAAPTIVPPYQTTDVSQSAPVYTPPPPSSQWQPGTYDMGATQPVDIPVSAQPQPAQPSEASREQTQSIFSPPPAQAQGQGQYTQPIAPQQGYQQSYTPPPPQGPQQTFTPPPAYSSQAMPPTGTQPLQQGQPYPNYQQYPPGYSPPQQAAAPKDPTTALMLELLGFLGFLGIGHIYAGKTNRGIALLIGWLAYLTASFVLSFCLIGCFMFLAWVVVPPLSGIWVKNEMEKERISGFRQ